MQIQGLCSELNLSTRNFQKSFNLVLGTSSLVYLRTLRFNGARNDLLSGRSMKDANRRLGFWHWSRFIQNYRHIFGEPPSAAIFRIQGTP